MADYRIETVRNGERDWSARNDRGAEVRIAPADSAAQPSFTPVELLLAALGGCGGLVVDRTARTVPHDDLRIVVESVSRPEDDGRVGAVRVTYELALPDGDTQAADAFERGVRLTHEKYCTVSRTVEHGARVEAIGPDGTMLFMGG
ncbi:OsmC family protein [Streptomyces sp. VRA16 Mangrove soil]|uniref:OsmC family protein n=1 Tax=Streptomyces sp. VRA16 Mangrove soil TaxID=2817434 RepID=UPI001A9FB378|nr:OsmC family protein [Streptomyces sp. VRA16 Mangrove soil]MBO1330606.1 OsmC family protein [Streptomyces sp. VRA16 Mangrove soil]